MTALPLGRLPGAYKLLRDAGYGIRCRENNVVEVDGDLATVTAILDSYNPLPDAKADKIASIKAEGLALIQVLFPAIADFEELALVREHWLSIAAAARNPTANWTKMVNTYTAGANAIASVKAAATVAAVNAVVPAWP